MHVGEFLLHIWRSGLKDSGDLDGLLDAGEVRVVVDGLKVSIS